MLKVFGFHSGGGDMSMVCAHGRVAIFGCCFVNCNRGMSKTDTQ